MTTPSLLSDEAVAFVTDLQRRFGPRRDELLAARRSAGPPRDFLAETAEVRAADWQVAPGPARAARPPGRDHRPDPAQDGGQRAQQRRQGLARGPRGREHPALGQRARGPAGPPRRGPAPARVHLPGGQALRAARRPAGGAAGPPARLAPRREAPAGRRPPDDRRAAGLRAALLPQRRGADRARRGPVLLPAQDGEPPRGPALERRLHPRPAGARHPARHGPRHGADRDHQRRVPDGGDPLRAARARLRAERRPVGLPLQRDQELPRRRRGVRAARTGPRSR